MPRVQGRDVGGPRRVGALEDAPARDAPAGGQGGGPPSPVQDLLRRRAIGITTGRANNSPTSAFVVILTPLLLSILRAQSKIWWPALGPALEGAPILLVTNGEPDAAALRRSRVELDDVMAAGR